MSTPTAFDGGVIMSYERNEAGVAVIFVRTDIYNRFTRNLFFGELSGGKNYDACMSHVEFIS